MKTIINKGVCQICSKPARKAGTTNLDGSIRYGKYCTVCHKKVYNQIKQGRRIGYRLHKESICAWCSFIPEHLCQLDVDHIDGNRHNNDISNLQTLCANCHRLKTHKSEKGG